MAMVKIERIAGMLFMGIDTARDTGCSVLNFSLDADVMNGISRKAKKFRAEMNKFCLESNSPVCKECRKGNWKYAWVYLQIYM